MKFLISILLIAGMSFSYAANNWDGSDNATKKQWIQTAVIYAVENRDPHQDYSRYIAQNYFQHADDKNFDFQQYVRHMQSIKALTKSMKVSFQQIVVENDTAAVDELVHGIKKDNTSFTVKALFFFKIRHNKIVYCDELTHLMKGNASDKSIGSRS